MVKNLPANAGEAQETQVRSLGGGDTLEKEMAPHSSALAPWTEEPGGLRSVGSQKSDTTKREHREPKLQQQKEKQRVKCEKFLYI